MSLINERMMGFTSELSDILNKYDMFMFVEGGIYQRGVIKVCNNSMSEQYHEINLDDEVDGDRIKGIDFGYGVKQ